jgi:undecaprenyl-diphosphatase
LLILQAIILGAVQGLTEFIPVSSSGHLIVIPKLFGWKDLGLTFDVALHMGTLVAVVGYFWRDWVAILRGFLNHLARKTPYKDGESRLLAPIIIACIPAAVVGRLFEKQIESSVREWYWVATALVVVAGVMVLAERAGKRTRDISEMGYKDFIAIGLAQACALFPGVSRSGLTISAGLLRDLDRTTAAKFSFLLATIVIPGAGILRLAELMKTGLPRDDAVLFVAGFLSAMVFGYAAIKFLMKYLQSHSLKAFAIYRVCFAALMAVVFLLR